MGWVYGHVFVSWGGAEAAQCASSHTAKHVAARFEAPRPTPRFSDPEVLHIVNKGDKPAGPPPGVSHPQARPSELDAHAPSRSLG